jgi:hypothetical protein
MPMALIKAKFLETRWRIMAQQVSIGMNLPVLHGSDRAQTFCCASPQSCQVIAANFPQNFLQNVQPDCRSRSQAWQNVLDGREARQHLVDARQREEGFCDS